MRPLAVVIMIGLLWPQLARANAPALETTALEAIRLQLRDRLMGVADPTARPDNKQALQTPALLVQFYANRDYHAAWISPAGLSSQVFSLLAALRMVEREGLPPLEAHLRALNGHLAAMHHLQRQHRTPDPARLAALDLLLSDVFFTLVGQLRPPLRHPQIDGDTGSIEPPPDDRVQRLQWALATDNLEAAWRSLVPTQPAYSRLRQALGRYRAIAANGGWPMLGDGPTLRLGDRGQRVVLLRSRLEITGDLRPGSSTSSALFGNTLEQAVRVFQRRHGLIADGIVDTKTRLALDVPARQRVHQLAMNMARWRQLPHDLGERHIRVNIPAFTLTVIEDGQMIMQMRIIVGKPSQPTPVFSHTVRYLMLNPYWNVPQSIATQEILPQVQQDRRYLDTHHMDVLNSWGDDAAEVEPSSIDWRTLQPHTFPYRFRQKPGPGNTLGQIKFMFPNKFNVYLHDTADKSLFTRSTRAFSHGCVRVARPVELAWYLLQNQPNWSFQRLLDTLKQSTPYAVRLPEPLPIHLVYETAWVEADGTVQFRNDLYGYDWLEDRDARATQATHANRLALTNAELRTLE